MSKKDNIFTGTEEEAQLFDDTLEVLLDTMSDKEMLEYIPPLFIRLAAKGFLAGMLGPKNHAKNSWLKLDLHPSADILPSFLRHIEASENETLDPDTGLEDNEAFVAARAIMYVYFKHIGRLSYRKDLKKIARYKDLNEYKRTANKLPPSKPLC